MNKDAAYRKLRQSIIATKAGDMVSDIYGGATMNKINGGWGHSTSYWRKDRQHLAIEAFADISSAKVYSKAELQVIKEYLPTAYSAYEEMVAEMVKG